MSNRIGIGIDVFGAGIDAEAKTIYNRIIADGGVSNLTRLNFFVKGLKAIYGDLANVPVCYDAHWIGYKLGSGTGATAGQAAAKLYSLTVAGDAVQTTAASQPLLLSHSGASSDNYWWGSGVAGNFVESQTQSTLLFGADFSATFYCDPLLATSMELGGNNSGGVNTTGFYIGSDRNMRASYLNILYTSTVQYAVGTKYFRYTMSGNNFQFYTSTDGINWVQLGTNLSVVVHTALPSNRIRVGNSTNAYALPTNGKIYSAKFYTDATLTNLVFDFNPATYNASTSQTAWTSATGEVWTISTGTATVGYKGVLVSRTIVQSDGVDDEMSSSAFAINQPNTSYTVYNYYNDISKTVVDGLTNDTRNLLTSSTVGVTGLYAGTLTFNVSGFSKVIRQLRTFGLNGATSYGFANNSSRTTGITGVLNASGVHLFRGGNGFGNNTFYTHINTSTLDTAQNNTDMYNLVRSLNNNSF
jgi:hypothetical protein